MVDFPCVCGHDKLDHPKVGRYNYNVCEECFRFHLRPGYWEFSKCCKIYKPDNLKYLEMKYEEKLKYVRTC